MNERYIQQALRRWFHNHKYLLVNSFVFSWESDFFSVTKSNTVYEVEVKISKADFRKDFSKEKHQMFKNMAAGKKFAICRSSYRNHGDDLFRVPYGILTIDKWFSGGDIDERFTHEEDSFGYWHLRERRVRLSINYRWVTAPATGIQIIDLDKRSIPNRFYYACPAGLLTKDDVPAYAGLLHIDDNGDVDMIKQAPFLHKRKLLTDNLLAILLDKFWYLSQEQRYKLVCHNIDFKDCSENKTTEA